MPAESILEAMPRVVFKDLPLRPDRHAGLPRVAHHILFACFLVEWTLVWVRLWLVPPPFGIAVWPEALLVFLTAAVTLTSLARQLPGQNVLLAAVGIAFIAGAVQSLGAVTGIPFGPYHYAEPFGPQFFHTLAWPVPFVWLVALLNARGVARLILRPWRHARNYGFWLIGLSVLLVVLFDFGLEPFASTQHYWTWEPTRMRCDWYGAPCVNFLGWALTALLILVFITPALLNKRPVKHPPNFYPLVIWLLVNLVLLTSALVHQLRPAVIVDAAGWLFVLACVVCSQVMREKNGGRKMERTVPDRT